MDMSVAITAVASALLGGAGGSGVMGYFMKRSNERLRGLEEHSRAHGQELARMREKEVAQNGSLKRIERAVEDIPDIKRDLAVLVERTTK